MHAVITAHYNRMLKFSCKLSRPPSRSFPKAQIGLCGKEGKKTWK